MDELRAIGAWIGREALLLTAALRSRGLWASLAAALLLWTLAYQLPAGHTLHVGGDPAARLRWYDGPFLTGFHAPEPEPPRGAGDEWYELPQAPYRWTRGAAAVSLPGLGGGAWEVRLTLAAPGPGPAPVTLQVGAAPPVTLPVPPGDPRTLRLIGPAEQGDVRLRIDSPTFTPPGDPRSLGVVVYRVAAAPVGAAALRAPAPGPLALLALALAGIFALAMRAVALAPRPPRATAGEQRTPPREAGASTSTWAPRAPLALALAFLLLAAYLLAVRRIDITIFAPLLAALVWLCYLLAALLRPALDAAGRGLGLGAGAGHIPALLAAAALGVRLAGALHPYARYSDTDLHANNLREVVLLGAVFFTEGLPCEAGAGESPYPPGAYLTLAPGMLIAGGEQAGLRLLLQGGVALLESLSAALIWLVLRRAGLGGRAALIGGALYVAATPLLRSLSVGEMANLFAQALVAPLLLLLAAAGAGGPSGREGGRWVWGGLGGALGVLLLSHSGATLSAAALVGVWLALWWAAGRERGGRGALPLLVSLVLPAVFAGAVFYSAFTDLLVERRAQAAAQLALPEAERCPQPRPLAAKLNAWVVDRVAGARPDIPPALAAAGGLGALLLGARGAGRGARRALGLVLAACWVGAGLSLATLLTSDQAVRWQHFLYPALCIGAAAALAEWGRRGRAGGALAAALAAGLVWYGLSDWVRQVADYLH